MTFFLYTDAVSPSYFVGFLLKANNLYIPESSSFHANSMLVSPLLHGVVILITVYSVILADFVLIYRKIKYTLK